MEPIRITRASLQDAATLGTIHAQGWHAAYKGIATDAFLADFTPQRRTAYFERKLLTTQNEHYLLHWADEPVGMMAIGPAGDGDATGVRCGEIHALYILPEHHGKGIGKAAMNFAITRMHALGFGDIVLYVISDNARARRFYDRAGFVPDSDESPFDMGRPVLERRYRLHRPMMW